jgi:hypothetical protein
MASIALPYTDPATWQPIPVSGAAGQVLVVNPLLDAPCYITIFVGAVVTSCYKCDANSSVTVTFPGGATAKAAACKAMTVTVTVV